MPAMTRRRPPPSRRTSSSISSSSSSSSSSRRNADTRNLVTAHQVFGNLELGGILRAVLLGACVGAVVIFLFYPDISSLLEHWNNSSEQQSAILQQRPTAATEKKPGVPSDSEHVRSVNANKKEDKVRSPSSTTKAKQSEPVKKAPEPAKPKDVKKKKKKKKKKMAQAEDSSCPCSCQCQQPPTPPSCQPPQENRPKPAKKEKVPKKEDLVEVEEEEEEVIEEEDPVEVELMEEEEDEQFIDLDMEEDPVPKSSSSSSGDETPYVTSPHTEDTSKDTQVNTGNKNEHLSSSKHSQSATPTVLEGKEEPLVLTDGQPITFTPLSSGDDNFIRVGGRPKPGQDPKEQGVAQQPKSHTHKQNSSARSDASSSSSSSSNPTAKKNEASSPKRPQGASSKKKASVSGPAGKDQDGRGQESDLPEEVKNFQPTFLKTVTAKKIFADGRRIPPMELLPQKETNSSVRVFLFNDFLSEAECDGLRRVHDKHVQEMASEPLLCFDSLRTLRKHLDDVKHDVRVSPNDFVTGTKCLNASFSRQLGLWMGGNWSYSTAFYPGESRFSSIFAARVQQAMGLQPPNGGKFQITSYPTGKAYKAHTDCVLEGGDPRDRVATVLVYLDDVSDGGETKFPELGIWVKPRKGRALVWNNMSPQGLCEPHSLHVASKVNAGSKYILIRWYYYKSFYSLGKRPPEPPLPARSPGTPRVSCDDYDNGSCRWYDEWNNDHLLDYEFNKYTLI